MIQATLYEIHFLSNTHSHTHARLLMPAADMVIYKHRRAVCALSVAVAAAGLRHHHQQLSKMNEWPHYLRRLGDSSAVTAAARASHKYSNQACLLLLLRPESESTHAARAPSYLARTTPAAASVIRNKRCVTRLRIAKKSIYSPSFCVRMRVCACVCLC